ncbi:two-component regulator propeller domain-containing protein [Sunxiuqinia rutila]|uniref:two-component regulator propeller domain-containing protein n=1 Tax=Sunxiuqinia rutila TaxID=1397841 RepID=UPI003D35E1F8
MKIVLITFLLCFFGHEMNGSNTDFTFRRISPLGGFSSESVNAIIQDQNDFIWVATNYGLLKYSMRDENKFSNEEKKSDCLKNGAINSLAIDRDGRIWVAISDKICVMDKATQLFSQFHYNDKDGIVKNKYIHHIASDNEGNIWIADQAGMGRLNADNGYLERLAFDNDEKPVYFYFDVNNNVWIGTQEGSVYKAKLTDLKPELFIPAQGNKVTSIYRDNHNIWIGYIKNGLILYSMDGTQTKKFDFNKAMGVDYDSWDIRKVIKDRSGTFWIATYYGLFIQQPGQQLLWIDSDKNEGLPNSSIFELFEDKQNGIWIGTWAGGISYYHYANNQFINYSHSKDPSSISNNMVSCFAQDSNGKIFVGTERGGLNSFDKQQGTFTTVPLSNDQNTYNIKYQCFDSFDGHWVATKANGLWHKPAGYSSYTHFDAGPEDGKHISFNEVYSLFPVDSGVWIGTHGGGLNFYHHKTKKISFQSSIFPNEIPNNSPFIKSIIVDSNSNIWIGTVSDIRCIPLKPNTPIKKNAQAGLNRLIYSITELKNGTIWIGTKTDLIIYNPKDDKFTSFNANNLLNNNAVYGVLEDFNQHIWITTNNGLVLYKPEHQTARHFKTSDGIQGLWFNPQSIFKDQDNLLYFGGTNGFTTVNTDNIKINTRPPKVIISDAIINNEKHCNLFYTNMDSVTNQLRLKPNETTLRFKFTSDNYLLPEKNRFQYRLVNFYDEWIEAGQEASAMFTNLKWGSYIFEVKSCNNDGIWCLEPARIHITITKPLYATNTAYITYLLLVGSILFFLIRILKARTKLRNDIIIQKIQHQQEEDINELKLSFFTNVSHEFKTPLSLISGPTKSLIEADNLTDSQREMVDIIQRNSKRLLILINQIIDFRKLEEGKEKLNLLTDDVIGFLKERSLHFSFDIQSKSISFTESYPDKHIKMEFDPEKLDYIIFNLLSNSFKFTTNNKKISLSLKKGKHQPPKDEYQNHTSFGELHTDETISILIEDEGPGIDAQDLRKVFDRFEQGKDLRKNSSGIGLSLCRDFTLMHKGCLHAYSTPGKGSCFVVQLPLKQEGENIYFESYSTTISQDLVIHEAKEKSQKSNAMVLIVEDNPDLRTYISSVLKPQYQTKTAENGKIALDILQSTAVDIIVSDVMMPEIDGFKLCAKIKSDMATSHIPVILLTALSSTENQITGMQLGADSFLPKPFDDELLLTQISNLLGQRAKLRKYFGPKIPATESSEMNGLDNYFLKKLNNIIEEHLNNEKFDIELLTSLIGISRSQLHRKLKNLTGYSTSEYIRIYRLEKAINLLKTNQYNIDEAAHIVGFSTHSYFTRSFRKHYNQTPKEYIAKLNQIEDDS